MRLDKDIDRFSKLVFLFVLSINLLIFVPNLAFLLIGWDGLGITSFILVIYYLNSKSLGAGIITAITNRIGDVFLLLSIVLCISQCHWYSFRIWYSCFCESKVQIVLILLAGITKRAQIPFRRWLPAAIAAPTPVSALVHSSTLVTAGVFLLIRFYDFLSNYYYFNLLLILVSIITMIISGLAAAVEWDIKKIIALSTLRQLGLIIIALSLNILELAYLHIVRHALFKALLFICAGNLIINFFHRQDLRWMGNLSLQMPFTSLCIILSSLAMAGFPFLASFYTKDLILELIIYDNLSLSVIFLMYFSIGITIFYSLRFCINLLWMVPIYCTLVSFNEEKNVLNSILVMRVITVSIRSLLLWIYPNFNSVVCINRTIILIPLAIIFLRFAFGIVWNFIFINIRFQAQLINNFIWYIVPLSTQVVLNYSLPKMKLYLELLDQSWLEYWGGYGSYSLIIHIYNGIANFINWGLIWIVIKIAILIIVLVCFSF